MKIKADKIISFNFLLLQKNLGYKRIEDKFYRTR